MRKFTILFSCFMFLSSIFANSEQLISGPEVENFIDYMVKKHDLDDTDLREFLYKTKYQSEVIATIQRPAEKLPWYKYEKIFLKEKRIKDGVKFWQENVQTLNKAYDLYGVPPEIIVSLIGIETSYGQNKGKFPVLDTLATLAFYYKPRSAFFTSELEHFLLFTHEENTNPHTYFGSYAGAMGYPQFISSSIRNYAVDFNNTGHRDLLNNVDDAIGSVANYLHKNGWQKDAPISSKASLNKLSKKNFQSLETSIDKLKPSFSVKQLKQSGVIFQESYNKHTYDQMKTNLVSFEVAENKKVYRAGFNNFYVITRYNISQNYALAAVKLSEKLKAKYQQEVAKNSAKNNDKNNTEKNKTKKVA